MPSTVIRKWEYDEAARRLDIRFVSGKRYSYHEVPPETVEEMRGALSKGSYYNHNIRDRFAFTRQGGARKISEAADS